MPQVWESGVAVTAVVNLENLAGDNIDAPDSAAYRVLDQDEAEVLASTNIVLSGDELQLSAVIAPAVNTLGAGEHRGYRTVEFTFVKDGDTYVKTFEYVIQGVRTLAVGKNSYQTYAQSIVLSMDMAEISHFKGATSIEQVTALANAYRSIGSVGFVVLGVRQPPLTVCTAAELALLDSEFISAVRTAQVIEANEVLNPNSIHKKRAAGLMAESIGESSVMFRPEKVMNNQPLTRRSMIVLSEWLDWSLSSGRA